MGTYKSAPQIWRSKNLHETETIATPRFQGFSDIKDHNEAISHNLVKKYLYVASDVRTSYVLNVDKKKWNGNFNLKKVIFNGNKAWIDNTSLTIIGCRSYHAVEGLGSCPRVKRPGPCQRVQGPELCPRVRGTGSYFSGMFKI